MNETELEALLNEDESSSLDFKRDQYSFDKASDIQKSKLIKDILAFANAWRRADAYILVGIEEVSGGRSVVRGVTNHLPESNVQQLINSKTNRPIEFSYQALQIEGKQVGVIRVPVQDRPYFLTAKYGNLQKDVVYIRRGTATDVADPDEIARMGAATILQSQLPAVDLQIADIQTGQEAGKTIEIEGVKLLFPEQSQIPLAQHTRKHPLDIGPYLATINENYYRQYARYFYIRFLTRPVKLVLKNIGSSLLVNARLQIIIAKQGGLQFYKQSQPPKMPTMYNDILSTTAASIVPTNSREFLQVASRGSAYEVLFEFGNVQPQAASLSNLLYIGAEQSLSTSLGGKIFADNLPAPVEIQLLLNISVHSKQMSLDDLYRLIDQNRQEDLKRVQTHIHSEEW